MRSGRRVAGAAWLLATVLCGIAPLSARGADPVPLAEADALAARPDDRDARRVLGRWMRDASLSELLYVLRRSGAELGRNESDLVGAALKRTADGRPALLRHLRLRMAAADPDRARRMLGEVGRDPGPLLTRARASVFNVGVLLPHEGPYAAYARSLRIGIEAGAAYENARGGIPVTIRDWNTGDDDPARSAAVLDSASRESAVLIGELLSVPTLALATGARAMRLPLVSPTATDEAVGRAGNTVFQVGPSGYHRGQTLGRTIAAGGPRRVAVLVSSERGTRPFHVGFTNAIEAAGGMVVWRDVHAPGNRDFRAAAKRLGIENVEWVFFDGEPDEAAALLRELQRQALNLRVCGGAALSPEQQHATTADLLEGARFVAEDWVLQPNLEAPLDSLVAGAGEGETNELHVRGFLAGRLVAAAVRGRALCAEEMTASLHTRVRGEPYLVERGFLDWSAEGASLPVFEVRRGESVALE